MSLVQKIRDNIAPALGTLAVGVTLTLLGAGALSWTDNRYVLQAIYSNDQVARGVLTIDMAIRQVDYRLRDAAQQEVTAGAVNDPRAAAQAKADQQFYAAEKQSLLRQRDDLLKTR